jgi:outer membrane immunogenic protein
LPAHWRLLPQFQHSPPTCLLPPRRRRLRPRIFRLHRFSPGPASISASIPATLSATAAGAHRSGRTGSFSVNGALAGGTIGGNYQFGPVVVGAEADFDWQNVRGSQVGGGCFLGGGFPASCASASNWVGTFRARVGYAMDRVLVYATGGGAFANIKASINTLPWASSTELGWTSGAGIEVAMTDNWTAKVEYLAVGFEHASCGLGNCLAVPAVSVSFFESMVRAGINYKF